jgi:hypothetical protein
MSKSRKRNKEEIRNFGHIIDSGQYPKSKILVGIPMTGLIRAEWAMARWGQAYPTNWSTQDHIAWLDQFSPLRFTVANARNLIANRAVAEGAEWVFFIDHDVLLPPGTLIKMDKYMHDAKYPIVSGLYFTKGKPAEPLVYRGMGTGYLRGWKLGKPVWVTGTGLGCTIINVKMFKAFSRHCEDYTIGGETKLKRFFRSPCAMVFDEEAHTFSSVMGTEDLDFYHRIYNSGCYKDAGWPTIQKKKNPILVDTTIFCRHIDNSGKQYPMYGEEKEFM